MSSLPDLPTELLLEMVNYYPELYLDIDDSIHRVASEQFVGDDTLRAPLSDLSYLARHISPPCCGPAQKSKGRAKMLERHMLSIQKASHVLPHIRSLSVTLGECNMNNLKPVAEFIRVLGMLPILQRLTIVKVSNEMVPVLSTACQGKVYLSILSLGFDNDNLAQIIPCFPNIQALTFHPGSGCIPFLRALKGSCEHVHTLNNLTLYANVIESDPGVRDSIPNVRRISVWQFALELLRLLENMDNLSDLRIRYREPLVHVVYGLPLPSLDEIVATAKRVLRTSKATGRKELHIQEFTGDILRKETLIIVGRDL
ncbi:hypothetical protein MVEN_01684500 [Mycena venus]|uniref:F-box domain-containing protein n=1 Tax=Mycena venus TaxID=2733690 RepID=A0A8H6XPF0_9AGAR|nr:hypothetical protein MVEN_01684500 [Mycena venus]